MDLELSELKEKDRSNKNSDKIIKCNYDCTGMLGYEAAGSGNGLKAYYYDNEIF